MTAWSAWMPNTLESMVRDARCGLAGGGVLVVLARTSARTACSTGSVRSSRSCWSPRTATPTADVPMTDVTSSARILEGLPTLRAVVVVPFLADAPDLGGIATRSGAPAVTWSDWLAPHRRRRAAVRAAAVRPPLVRAVQLRHHRACPSASCTAPAGCSSSTSRSTGSTWTSVLVTGSRTSRRAAG